MENDSSTRNQRARLAKAVRSFDVAMLVTRSGGDLNARPMTIVSRVEEIDELLFVAHKDGLPANEVTKDPRVSLFMQSPHAYVHLLGHAEVVDDRGLAMKHWRSGWLEWFSEGPRSPSLVFIRVRPSEGEYWDGTMTASLRYLFDRSNANGNGGVLGQ